MDSSKGEPFPLGNRDYLTQCLSDEMLLRIFSFVHDHDDLINLSESCKRLNNLLRDKKFCEKIKLSWCSQVARSSVTRFMRDRARAGVITKLDLSDLYFIPSGIIRDLVLNMQSLKIFLSAGTCLSWTHLAQLLKTLPIIKLSWSWDNSLEESCRRRSSIFPTKFTELTEMKDYFLKLQSLLIHIPMMTKIPTDVLFFSYTSLEYLVSLCHNLEELWFLSFPRTSAEIKSSSSSYSRRDLDGIDFTFNYLHTLVISVRGPSRFSPMTFFSKLVRNFGILTSPKILWVDHPLLSLSGENNTNSRFLYQAWTSQMCAENTERLSYPLMSINVGVKSNFKYRNLKHVLICHGQPMVLGLGEILDDSPHLQSFTCSAFNLRMDWEKFAQMHPKLKNVSVSEGQGLDDYCVPLSKLSDLEKLSVAIDCLYEVRDSQAISDYMISQMDEIQTKEICDNSREATPILFKKRRMGVSVKLEDNKRIAGLNLFSANCPKLNELEIGYGNETSSKPGRLLIDSLFTAAKFKHLTKLSLTSLPIINGKFLIEICSSCKLEFLRLTHCGPQAKCCYIQDLCQALKLCQTLKDLRLEQNYIGNPFPLLNALKNCSNLQRLLIWSSPNDRPLELDPVNKLFENCKKLMMFYATIEPTTKADCIRIRKALEAQYKSERPALSVIIRRVLEEEELIHYPSIHYRQMVVNLPQVCQFIDFNEFNNSS